LGLQSAKLIRAGAATAMFVVLLALAYVVHARYLPVDVVLYSALGDVLVATAAAATLLWGLRWFAPLQSFEKLQLVVIWLLLGYAFAISVPALIDRSLSFYLLEKLEQRGGGIRQDAFRRVFVEEYLPEHRLVDVRLTEQLESGTIRIERGCVLLTPHGRRMAAFSRAVRRHLLPRRRLLLGTYSDALTEIYRNSPSQVDYACTAGGPATTDGSVRP
jgi:hypothetical protein